MRSQGSQLPLPPILSVDRLRVVFSGSRSPTKMVAVQYLMPSPLAALVHNSHQPLGPGHIWGGVISCRKQFARKDHPALHQIPKSSFLSRIFLSHVQDHWVKLSFGRKKEGIGRLLQYSLLLSVSFCFCFLLSCQSWWRIAFIGLVGHLAYLAQVFFC
ncbi:hypothetical protein V8F33_003264 [Rhypophila sp. PSN 637]